MGSAVVSHTQAFQVFFRESKFEVAALVAVLGTPNRQKNLVTRSSATVDASWLLTV
jgi:hypothetical protein